MKIGIVGAGNVGGTIARRLVRKGHAVAMSFSLDKAGLERTAKAVGAEAVEPAEVAGFGEVVVLATPWGATEAAVRAVGNLTGKVVWDCTNPLAPDMNGLLLGTDTSGGEKVAAWVGSGAQVVKAIPPFAELMAKDGPLTLSGGSAPGVFVCGDDRDARAMIAGLVRDIGAEPVDAGPLRYARFTEPAAMLLVQLAYAQGRGSSIGLSLVHG